MTVYCFDIDGTICSNTEGDYEQAVPFKEAIERINRLYEEGHQILFYTARGSTTGIDWMEVTANQLREWNVHYHKLFMGKPTADIYIDDKALHPNEFFGEP
ncbi:hypothetical protein ACFLVJ_02215 [Chloroflexota bacterium]